MKVPLKWLAEFVEMPAKSKELAEMLTMSGTKVEALTHKNGSDIVHLEITTNRPDCLSLWGVAVEIAALTGKKIEKRVSREPKPSDMHLLPISIDVRDKRACPKYAGRTFDCVAVKPSPLSIQRNLDWMDQKSVNNVVDITNICLYELGQPLHAFDYDKIKGGRIVVRRAKKGEKILAIDGNEYLLDERILVVADAERPIAIAGVMGGKDTEVTESTKRVFLESAQFDPILIRQASRFLKITTESSYRFERTVDPRRTREASDRASELFVKWAGAIQASRVVEVGVAKTPKGTWMRLRHARVEKILGLSIRREKITRILNALGFKVKRTKKDFKVKTLLQRRDVKTEIDLIEEIARIHGFDKIPEAIPMTRHAYQSDETGREYHVVRRIKEFLAAGGLLEAVTHSLVSEKSIKNIRHDGRGLIRVANAMSHEQEVMCPSGLPGLLGVLSHNVNRKEKDLAFFEVAKRFLNDAEENVLSIALTGSVASSWEFKRQSSFYYLKGLVDNVINFLRKDGMAWARCDKPAAGLLESAEIPNATGNVAECGVVDAVVAAEWDLKQPVYFAEVNLDLLLRLPEKRKACAPLPKFPPVKRDVAFVTAKNILVEDIQNVMRAAADPHMKNIALFDQYTGQNIPKDKRSLAFSMEYQKKDGTFTDDEIRAIDDKVRAALVKEFEAELR